jgi:hypothetical protein
MRSWQAVVGIGLIVVYSAVMVMTEGAAPFAWVILGAALALLAMQARNVVGKRQAHRD